VSVKAAPPADALAGASEDNFGAELVLVMVKVDVPDVPPPGVGLLTVTLPVPALAMSDAGTGAVSFVSLTKVVVSAVPFQSTVEEETKLVPLTVSVNAAPPAEALAGAIEETAGTGLELLIVNVEVPDAPPPGVGLLTVILAVPALAMSASRAPMP
jgi:hypothetical protein